MLQVALFIVPVCWQRMLQSLAVRVVLQLAEVDEGFDVVVAVDLGSLVEALGVGSSSFSSLGVPSSSSVKAGRPARAKSSKRQASAPISAPSPKRPT